MYAKGLYTNRFAPDIRQTNLPNRTDQMTCKIQLKTTKMLASLGPQARSEAIKACLKAFRSRAGPIKARSETPWQLPEGLNPHRIDR